MPFNQMHNQRGRNGNTHGNRANTGAAQGGNWLGMQRQNPIQRGLGQPPQQPPPQQPQRRAPFQQPSAPPQQPPSQPTQAAPPKNEPIDPELLKMLQDAAAKEDAEIMRSKGISPQPANTEKIAEKLALFAQNEKNGAKFYKELASIAPTEKFGGILSEIGRLCGENSVKYSEMYEKIKGEGFAAADRDVYAADAFGNGVSVALSEESGYLAEMAAIYETVRDEATARRINALILRKISDLQILAAMRNAVY